MSRGRERTPARTTARWVGAGCLLLLAGCVAESGTLDRDPLLGGPPLPRSPAPASPYASVSHPAPPSSPVLPADPSPGESAGPAALAFATGRPEPERDLRMPGPPATLTGGARLGGPQPEAPARLTSAGATAPGVTPVAVTPAPRAPSAPAPEGLDAATFEQLQAMLAARGVAWQVLEVNGPAGQWKFTCGIPNHQAPGTWRNYEGVGAGANGLDAIRAALREIDRTQAR
jgi:hypothetical protein